MKNKMTAGQRKRWAQSWLATATKNGSAPEVIAYWQNIIDEIEAAAFQWLGQGN
jgi:hypothetical protein